jgi:hypothetical protein
VLDCAGLQQLRQATFLQIIPFRINTAATIRIMTTTTTMIIAAMIPALDELGELELPLPALSPPPVSTGFGAGQSGLQSAYVPKLGVDVIFSVLP